MEATLGYALQRGEALSLGELSHYVAADANTVRRHLAGYVARGEVEELRPVAAAPEDRHIFFRWRRPGDGACVEQQRFFEGARRRARSLSWYEGQLIHRR